MKGGPVLVAWRRLGPYHHARLRAASGRLPIVALEISDHDSTYAWAPVDAGEGYRLLRLVEGVDVDTLELRQLRDRIADVMRRIRPIAIAVHGWGSREALVMLEWAKRNDVATVVMSESNAFDEPRRRLREWLKRRVVGLADAALVGGRHSAEYVRRLGVPGDRVSLGYDAVDNDHFARGADAARCREDELRSSLGLPKRYFLASARFVPKKNLARLLTAYATYRRGAGPGAWGLVILGDGELRGALEALRATLDLRDHVLMPGFKQYDELPAWYGLASAFVHASTVEQWGLVVNEAMAAGLPVLVSNRCGCASDLVSEGCNGYTFDPHDQEGIADALQRMTHNAVSLGSMGTASRRLIAGWGVERFADGLAQAVRSATAARRGGPGMLARPLLRLATFAC